jgi:hypothetical protein
MAVTYHVAEHDGIFRYRIGNAWSETLPDAETAS